MLNNDQIGTLVNLLILRDLLDKLHDAIGASEGRGQAELFTVEARAATAGEPAIEVSRIVTRPQRLEVLLEFTTG